MLTNAYNCTITDNESHWRKVRTNGHGQQRYVNSQLKDLHHIISFLFQQSIFSLSLSLYLLPIHTQYKRQQFKIINNNDGVVVSSSWMEFNRSVLAMWEFGIDWKIGWFERQRNISINNNRERKIRIGIIGRSKLITIR